MHKTNTFVACDIGPFFCILSDIDNCKPNPCENDGTCTDLIDDFKCDCKTGFSGKKCEISE